MSELGFSSREAPAISQAGASPDCSRAATGCAPRCGSLTKESGCAIARCDASGADDAGLEFVRGRSSERRRLGCRDGRLHGECSTSRRRSPPRRTRRPSSVRRSTERIRVLRAARDAGVRRVVYTSSCGAVYYGHPERRDAVRRVGLDRHRRRADERVREVQGARRTRSVEFHRRDEGGESRAFCRQPRRHLRSRAERRSHLVAQSDPTPARGHAGHPRPLVRDRRCARRRRAARPSPSSRRQRQASATSRGPTVRSRWCRSLPQLRSRLGEAAHRVPSRVLPNWLVRGVGRFNARDRRPRAAARPATFGDKPEGSRGPRVVAAAVDRHHRRVGAESHRVRSRLSRSSAARQRAGGLLELLRDDLERLDLPAARAMTTAPSDAAMSECRESLAAPASTPALDEQVGDAAAPSRRTRRPRHPSAHPVAPTRSRRGPSSRPASRWRRGASATSAGIPSVISAASRPSSESSRTIARSPASRTAASMS